MKHILNLGRKKIHILLDLKKKKNTEKQGNIGCLNVETLIVAYELYQSSFCKVFPLSVTNISG